MLFISRKPGEGIKIGEFITIIVVKDPRNTSRVRLCITSDQPVFKLENLPQTSGIALRQDTP